MISTTEFRTGAKVEISGEPFIIVDYQHVKPGKGGAFVRTKLKSLKSGNVLDRTFRSGETLETPDIEEKEMQFLYSQEAEFHFMDTSTYEQLYFSKEQIGENWDLLKENMHVQILIYKGQPLTVEIPNFVELKITKTDPGVRGDTATGGTKPAMVETGATVKVPLFMEEGEVIKIDTRSRSYVERVK
ncbi:MAG TPA: elongation factor P [Nitrospiria bacterium]|nr:elongation factor P [Nitrospiria bacterium]